MKQKNDESNIVFWMILGRFWGHFLTHFGDFGALDVKTRRTGKHVKMSTALKREAHLRGFIGLENCQKTTRNRNLDTHFSRDDFGSQLGDILDDLGFQKGPLNESKTTSKMRFLPRGERDAVQPFQI